MTPDIFLRKAGESIGQNIVIIIKSTKRTCSIIYITLRMRRSRCKITSSISHKDCTPKEGWRIDWSKYCMYKGFCFVVTSEATNV